MYVIVNTQTSRIVKSFPSERGAKISLKRKYAGEQNPHLVVMHQEAYDVGFRKQVAVRSLMSGKTVMIDASQVGGCCDPSTETYWSM